MAAAQTDDRKKNQQEIFNLETEGAEIEKQILSGTISQEEGQRKKADLTFRLAELNTAAGTVEQPQETDDKTHKEDKSHKDDGYPHPHQETDHTEEPAESQGATETSPTDTDTTDASSFPTDLNPEEQAVAERVKAKIEENKKREQEAAEFTRRAEDPENIERNDREAKELGEDFERKSKERNPAEFEEQDRRNYEATRGANGEGQEALEEQDRKNYEAIQRVAADPAYQAERKRLDQDTTDWIKKHEEEAEFVKKHNIQGYYQREDSISYSGATRPSGLFSERGQQNANSASPQGRGKQKVAKKAGKFMMYTTPGGFIVGKTAPRIKERLLAKKEVDELGKTIIAKAKARPTQKTAAKKPPSPAGKAKNGFIKYFTPMAWVHLGNKFLPENIKTPIKKLFPQKEESESQENNKAVTTNASHEGKNQTQTPPQSSLSKPSHHKDALKAPSKPVKPPTPLGKTKSGLINTFTPMGFINLGKKFLPEKVKAPLRKFMPKREDTAASSENHDAKEKHQSPNPPHVPKTAKDYQKIWNKNYITKALSKGYNRYGLAQHVQQLKNAQIWKSKGWTNAKKFVSPTFSKSGYGGQFIRRGKSSIAGKGSPSSPTSPSTHAPSPQVSQKISEWTSPRSLGNKAWNRFGGNRISSMNSAMGRRLGNTSPSGTAKNMGGKAARKIGNKLTSKLTQQAEKQAVQLVGKLAIMNPPVLIGIGVAVCVVIFIAVLITIILAITGGGDDTALGGGSNPPPVTTPSDNPIPGFTISISTSDTQISQLETITYTVNTTYSVTDSEKINSITLYDDLPAGTIFVDSTGVAEYNPTTNRISWGYAEAANRSSFTFTLRATGNDILVNNNVYAIQTTAAGEGAPPTADNCNGAYALNNPVGNFGDPDCYFASNKEQAMSELYDLLKTYDPANAYNWYFKVIPCESVPSYNPNSHSSAEEIGSPDSAGVWGMFSMGRGLNGEFDHGDVVWRNQVVNALTYGNNLKRIGLPLAGEDGGYWECWNKKYLL